MTKSQLFEKKNMSLIGILQDFGKPYASLFLDRDSNGLYLFVRVISGHKDNSSRYIAVPVTADEISRYLGKEIGLKSMFSDQQYADVSINGGIAYFNLPSNVKADEDIAKEDIFDPEYCYDKLKLKVFLKRFQSA